jgi:hypothetical protein
MGRTAYESISGSMTTSTDHPFAPILNAARKVVFSRTLKTADWANTTIAAGDTAEEIDKLRQGGHGRTGLPDLLSDRFGGPAACAATYFVRLPHCPGNAIARPAHR